MSIDVVEGVCLRTLLPADDLERVRALMWRSVEAQEEAKSLRAERDALRALVDCATRFDVGDVKVIRSAGPASPWWVCPRGRDNEMVDTRDEAIARARELAK